MGCPVLDGDDTDNALDKDSFDDIETTPVSPLIVMLGLSLPCHSLVLSVSEL